MVRGPGCVVLTNDEISRVGVEHALPCQVEQSVATTPAAPLRVVYWTSIESVLHSVQKTGRVAFHDELDVRVQRAERADLKVSRDVIVVDQAGICTSDVLILGQSFVVFVEIIW